jgi:glycine cleavage system pyridoxal-binding protein P
MEELSPLGFVFTTDNLNYFDTISIDIEKSGFSSPDFLISEFHKHGINIRKVDDNNVSVSFDEMTTLFDLDHLIEVFISIKKKNVLYKD